MSLQEELRDILINRKSGSLSILEGFIELSIGYLSEEDAKVETIHKSLQELLQAFPDFAALHHFARSIDFTSEQVLGQLQFYKEEWAETAEKVAHNAIEQLPLNGATILLHSQSETLKQIAIHAPVIKVIQTESLPNGEGRIQAGFLKQNGVEVELIRDDDVRDHPFDLAFLGADSIGPEYFVNKLGSLNIATHCRDIQMPLWVLADSRKFTDKSPSEPRELFELVPRDMLSGIITEKSIY